MKGRSAMATVWIPPLLRDLTAGAQSVAVPGETVRDLIAALDARYPGLADRLSLYQPFIPGMRDAFWQRLIRAITPS
jgi:hypothetical protein